MKGNFQTRVDITGDPIIRIEADVVFQNYVAIEISLNKQR